MPAALRRRRRPCCDSRQLASPPVQRRTSRHQTGSVTWPAGREAGFLSPGMWTTLTYQYLVVGLRRAVLPRFISPSTSTGPDASFSLLSPAPGGKSFDPSWRTGTVTSWAVFFCPASPLEACWLRGRRRPSFGKRSPLAQVGGGPGFPGRICGWHSVEPRADRGHVWPWLQSPHCIVLRRGMSSQSQVALDHYS